MRFKNRDDLPNLILHLENSNLFRDVFRTKSNIYDEVFRENS